jgi:type III secretion protein D
MDEGIPGNLSPQAAALSLRIIAGVHRGAMIPLDHASMIVIGSADDGDVILADAGVASHHCIFRKQGASQLLLRAVDGPMTINGQTFDPGTTVEMHIGARVMVGAATFDIVTPEYLAIEVQEAPEPEESQQTVQPEPTPELPRRSAPVSVFGAGLNRIAPVVADAEGIQQVFARQPHLADVLRKSGLNVWLVAAALAAIVVAAALLTYEFRGHVAQTAVTQPVMPAQVAPRAGDAIAHDVAEVLRLSGIACEAKYSDDGTVTVSGHLGNSLQLASVIKSRAMHEIVGLKRVAVSNFDQGNSGHGGSEDGSRIVSVVASADPYVVTADGSRYYVGASLPQGGRLAGVKEGEVLVERDGRTEVWKLAAPTRESGEYSPTVSQSAVLVKERS